MPQNNRVIKGEKAGSVKFSDLRDGQLPGNHDEVLTVAGSRRTYRLHLPTGLIPGELLPLVVMLHGGDMTGVQMERISGLSETADHEHFAVAYPDAIGRFKSRAHCWNDGRVPEVDDVAFVAALIDELVAKAGVDPRRVYIAGYSNGACMAHRLGVELSDKVAAIATVAGTIDRSMLSQWQPQRPMPVLHFHGTADPFAYYDGGTAGTYPGASLSADQCVQWWAKNNGCAAEPGSEELAQDSSGLEIKRYFFSGGCEGADVVFYRIEGGGHTWPGKPDLLAEKLFGKTAADLDASEIIWQFFKDHRT